MTGKVTDQEFYWFLTFIWRVTCICELIVATSYGVAWACPGFNALWLLGPLLWVLFIAIDRELVTDP